MMSNTTSTIALLVAALMTTAAAVGQEKPLGEVDKNQAVSGNVAEKPLPALGFVDKNRDGINDLFVDADGDGRNDVDGKPYPHSFPFTDKDKDGINDLWVDRDGDGVNDLGRKLKRRQRHDVRFNVLDLDGDGRNDITGAPYDARKGHWMGERWGFWDEAKGKLRGRFMDENGDGIDDRLQGLGGPAIKGRHGTRAHDIFIDEDGDGICDGRSDVLHRMGRTHHGRKHGGRHRR